MFRVCQCLRIAGRVHGERPATAFELAVERPLGNTRYRPKRYPYTKKYLSRNEKLGPGQERLHDLPGTAKARVMMRAAREELGLSK